MGLVNEVVVAEELDARVNTLAGVLAENSPESLRATKKLLAAQSNAWLDAAVELSLEANAGARETKDFYEGVTAFLEKRKACVVLRGRRGLRVMVGNWGKQWRCGLGGGSFCYAALRSG